MSASERFGIARIGSAFARRIDRRVRPLWTALNERILNVRTLQEKVGHCEPAIESTGWWKGSSSVNARHNDNYVYASPDYWYIRKIIKLLKPAQSDIIYDLGSGMGRIVCVAARRPVQKCVGVELFESLCEVSRRNARQLRGQKAPIEIICGDCTSVDLSDGTIYVMFNPFGPATMRDTLARIGMSLKDRPRMIKIVYYNAVHEEIFESCVWLRRYYSFQTVTGLKVSFWEGSPSLAASVLAPDNSSMNSHSR